MYKKTIIMSGANSEFNRTSHCDVKGLLTITKTNLGLKGELKLFNVAPLEYEPVLLIKTGEAKFRFKDINALENYKFNCPLGMDLYKPVLAAVGIVRDRKLNVIAHGRSEGAAADLINVFDDYLDTGQNLERENLISNEMEKEVWKVETDRQTGKPKDINFEKELKRNVSEEFTAKTKQLNKIQDVDDYINGKIEEDFLDVDTAKVDVNKKSRMPIGPDADWGNNQVILPGKRDGLPDETLRFEEKESKEKKNDEKMNGGQGINRVNEDLNKFIEKDFEDVIHEESVREVENLGTCAFGNEENSVLRHNKLFSEDWIQSDFVKPGNDSVKNGIKAFSDSGDAEFRASEGKMQDSKAPEHKANFYSQVEAQLNELFKSYPKDDELERLIDGSEFVRVNYGGGEDYYVVGKLQEGPVVTHICYGVPSISRGAPPKQLDGFCQWLPLDPKLPDARGYHMMYQDAVTGENIEFTVL